MESSHEESSHSTEQSAPRQRRRRLNPFLRKPLWVVLEDCGQEVGTTNGAKSRTITASDVDNGIELPQRHTQHTHGDDEHEEEFSYEYQDNNDDHHISPLSNQTPTQSQLQHQHHHHTLPPRHLTLFDLVSIGVGGTIGSGIFVLNGLIANQYAGPATFLSWIISGIAALLSGCCYAELSGRIPSAGSSYAYAFVALGELPAFVTAAMLTLEFLLSGSAVAR